jgi:hypothetical protein
MSNEVTLSAYETRLVMQKLGATGRFNMEKK